MTNDAAKRLGDLVRDRRRALKLTQLDVQNAGGPSTATLRLIEGGRHTDFRATTARPLEEVLQWQIGSINNVLDGGDPTPLQPGTATQKPLRERGQTSEYHSRPGALADVIGVADSTTAALEEINEVLAANPSDSPAYQNLVKAHSKISNSIGIIVIACELLGEALASEDIRETETVGDFADRLDDHAAYLDKIRSIAHRLRAALLDKEYDYAVHQTAESDASDEARQGQEALDGSEVSDRVDLITGADVDAELAAKTDALLSPKDVGNDAFEDEADQA